MRLGAAKPMRRRPSATLARATFTSATRAAARAGSSLRTLAERSVLPAVSHVDSTPREMNSDSAEQRVKTVCELSTRQIEDHSDEMTGLVKLHCALKILLKLGQADEHLLFIFTLQQRWVDGGWIRMHLCELALHRAKARMSVLNVRP